MVTSDGELEDKNCSKMFFKVLGNISRTIILTIINQNILAILKTFSNLQKMFIQKLTIKERTSRGATTEFPSKIPTREKQNFQ